MKNETTEAQRMLGEPMGFLPDLIRAHGRRSEKSPALIQDGAQIGYATLDAWIDRIAAGLQRDGVAPRDVVAICAATSFDYIAVFLAILRVGAAVAPLASTASVAALRRQVSDAGARIVFTDRAEDFVDDPKLRVVALEGSSSQPNLDTWMPSKGEKPRAVQLDPQQPFNIIYSSGTTGAPKGIVQSHAMRWAHLGRRGYSSDVILIVSTPLYSNTTLTALLPTLAHGGTAVLMRKFSCDGFLELAQEYRATHAMLVPVQYKRLMEWPAFDRYDLRSFRLKLCTSAPFPASLKAEVLRRWPGGLLEYYGMTEGGGACMLAAHEFPDKLHTVGRPLGGHDIRLIRDDGTEAGPGEVGEVVGRSPAMMTRYHNLEERTSEAEWFNDRGERFIRTGDIGRFDEDGFLILVDRKKDVIISGGFNIYPSDLEAELLRLEGVSEAAVVGVPSERWGETPVGCVVLDQGTQATPESLMAEVNTRLGAMQRLADIRVVEALPRNPLGKVLKSELKNALMKTALPGSS